MQTRHSWLGHKATHHGYAHFNAGLSTEQNQERLTEIARWYAQQFRYLLEKLDSVPEGGGTMLDNTVVLWTSEHKQKGGDHSRRDVPFVLAGGSYFKHGQAVDCNHRAHNDIYVSLCHSVGLTNVTSFGNAKVCKGPMPGLT